VRNQWTQCTVLPGAASPGICLNRNHWYFLLVACCYQERSLDFVSLDTGSAAGRLVINIMTAVSQWEREAIGERTRDAMNHKRSNGERVGNIAYGFRLSADSPKLEPDPQEQAVLTAIRDLRARRFTLRGIAASLNRQGHRTRRASEWRLESVARVIRRESVVQQKR
jgi:DNA invertase Pin-like site-specific DNA recombinase